jgi:hypothetical protein
MDFRVDLILDESINTLSERSCGHIGHDVPNERLTGLEFFFDESRQRLSDQRMNNRGEIFLREDVP